MSDEPTALDPAELGWVVTDPDGNVIASGPLTHAQAAFLIGEASDTEGEQE
jgi:hypothetical protein